MKKRLLSLVLVFAIASVSFAGYGVSRQSARGCLYIVEAKEKNSESKTEIKPVQQFGFKLMKQYLTEKNPVMSPVSAYVMLSMAGNGAKGATKKEFQKVLGTDMLTLSKSMMDTLPQEKDGTQLTIANSVWMDDMFIPQKKWLEKATKQMSSDVFQAQLGTNTAKNKINKWVSERTNKMIPQLLTKKLDEETRLALVNALYFHADWQQQFMPEVTRKGDFKPDGGKAVKADMMHATIYHCGYFKDQESEGVVLPYKDSNFAFVAVKPSGEKSIREWYDSYSTGKLSALAESRETKAVKLTLPKFKVRCRMNLNEGLKNLGIKRAFHEKKADLSLLGKSEDGENLYLSLVLQEAVISVAEEGTEAAAATIGAAAAGAAMIPDMPSVQFDRSFLYMIMDMDSGVPVFMGILDQP